MVMIQVQQGFNTTDGFQYLDDLTSHFWTQACEACGFHGLLNNDLPCCLDAGHLCITISMSSDPLPCIQPSSMVLQWEDFQHTQSLAIFMRFLAVHPSVS